MIAVLRAVLVLITPIALAQQPSGPPANARSPFVSMPVRASDSLRFGAQLPQFETRDIRGRVWRSEDLLGKFTFIYLWGTFAARETDKLDPHARESLRGLLPDLPELQRFYDEVKDSSNIQVLTFCGDYDYTHAPEYIQQTGYTFPVIADWVLLRKLFPGRWNYVVIDPEGRLSDPFRDWTLGRVLFEVERAAARPR